MSDGLRVALGLSVDAFYRRVRLLTDAGLIVPGRGSRNRLILSERDGAVLRRFCALAGENVERSMEWVAERLRYELERERRETVESALSFARVEVSQLRGALVRVRRHPVRRFWLWLRRRLDFADE